MRKRPLTVNSLLIFLLLTCLQSAATAQEFVTDKHRPNRSWVNFFDGATKVFVNTTIEKAMQQCPVNQYCDIIVPSLTLTNTVSINRSRTRLTGADDNTILIEKTNFPAGFVFQIEQGTSEVILNNLNIDGESIERPGDIFGFGAYGPSITKVLISNNRIQRLYGQDNAHAIAFYGTGKTDDESIDHIIIQNNRINDMRTGSSEAIALNGNVRHWEVSNNTIKNINNIAIDAIGGEGTAPTQILSDGRIVPGPVDAARLGFIENNTIVGMSTRANPAYGNKASWAAAIYIDGAHSINVTGNTVKNVPWGFEIGAENCISSSHIQLNDNQSSETHFGDILVGGYSEGGYLELTELNCNPHKTSDDTEGHGFVNNIEIGRNQLNSEKSSSPTFIGNTVLQHRITQSNIEPPVVNLSEL